MVDYSRAIRDLARTMEPPAALKQQAAVAVAIDDQGKVNPDSAAALRTPLHFQWTSGDTSPKWTPRAGTAVLIAAYAATPPSSGDALITITDTLGNEVGTITIPQNEPTAEAVIAQPVNAGSWLFRTITTANGASGVAVALVIRL